MRSKRRCVLEKKQPYSGDEWCSGPDTEEDEDKLHSSASHRESVCLRGGGETHCQLSECSVVCNDDVVIVKVVLIMNVEMPSVCFF